MKQKFLNQLRSATAVALLGLATVACTPSNAFNVAFDAPTKEVSANNAGQVDFDLVLKNNGNLPVTYEVVPGKYAPGADAEDIFIAVTPSSAPGTIAPNSSQTWKVTVYCPVDEGKYSDKITAKQGIQEISVNLNVTCLDAPIPDVPREGADVIDTTKGLISYNYDTGDIVFKSDDPQLPNIQVGNGVVAKPSPQAPQGFLRKVASITPNGATTLITTEKADLTAVIKTGDVNETQTANAALIKSTSRMAGVVRTQSLRPQAELAYTFNEVLVDADNNPATTDDQFRINGNVSIVTKLIFKADFCFNLFSPNTLNVKLSTLFEEKLNLAAVGTVAAKVSKRINIASLELPSLTFWVGIVPIVIFNKLDVFLDVSLDINGKFSYSVNQGFALEVGVEYDNGTLKGIWNESKNFDQNFNFTGNLTASAYIGARVSMLVYGVIGPFGELAIGPKVDVSSKDANNAYPYTIDGCIKANAGLVVQFEIIGFKLDVINIPLFNACTRITQGAYTPPA